MAQAIMNIERNRKDSPGPRPLLPKLDVAAVLQTQGPNSGINAIRGQWPGNESDEEVFAALEDLS